METKKVMYFTVDTQGVVDFARQRYWFEDAKRHGVKLLQCFIGIESYQITRILGGDATVIDIDGKRKYAEIPDEDFKQKLKDFLEFRRKNDEANFMWLGGMKVERSLVDTYAGHIVKRLRDTMRNTHYGIMFEQKDIDEILGLETSRQEMHDAILESVGFDRNDPSDEACEFRRALDAYVDEKAGTLTLDSIEEMSQDEIDAKRKMSDNLMKYMENVNYMVAKQRGLI